MHWFQMQILRLYQNLIKITQTKHIMMITQLIQVIKVVTIMVITVLQATIMVVVVLLAEEVMIVVVGVNGDMSIIKN